MTKMGFGEIKTNTRENDCIIPPVAYEDYARQGDREGNIVLRAVEVA